MWYALPIHTLAICGTLGSWRRPSSGIRSWKVFVFDLENDKNNCSAIYNDTTDLPSNDYTRVSICAGHGTWAWCGVTPVPLPPHTSETWWGVPYYCLCSNSSCAPEKEKGVSTDIISQVRSSNILRCGSLSFQSSSRDTQLIPKCSVQNVCSKRRHHTSYPSVMKNCEWISFGHMRYYLRDDT